MKALFFKDRFFICIGLLVFLFALSYVLPALFVWIQALFLCFVLLVAWDYIALIKKGNQISLQREVQEKLSLGDEQYIKYRIENKSKSHLYFSLEDELPYQLQHRDGIEKGILNGATQYETEFAILPLKRGLYRFGKCHLFIANPWLKLVERRISFDLEEDVKVVPSILQMKKYELEVFAKTARKTGVRRIRQIGENDEFEHIKAYAQGDNIKAINWKATSRRDQLMVNQFQNTKSQNVYCIIDKGRSMKMPFDGLSLLDYAINSALVISNIVLRKYDRCGLITFSDRIGNLTRAESTPNQLERISEALNNQKTDFLETNYELLHNITQKRLNKRSIILLFTNFENYADYKRNVDYLRQMNKRHLLLVILFINTELIETSEMTCVEMSDIYLKTFAQKSLYDKERIKTELHSNGIQCILTKPVDLSINVINKYLEIKAKRKF